MKKLIILLLILAGYSYSQTPAGYSFDDVSTWWGPKDRPFGTSTTWHDSTNYVTLNKGLYVRDSVKMNKNLFVKGSIYLDTNGLILMNASGQDMFVANNKENGSIEWYSGEKNSNFSWIKNSGGSSLPLMYLDTINGLQVQGEDISTTGTGQVKAGQDTVSDYDANDAVTLNRQVTVIRTKSLTTAAGSTYTISLANSLSTVNSAWTGTINIYGGTGTPIILRVDGSSLTGTITITFLNIHASAALNNTITFTITLNNKM